MQSDHDQHKYSAPTDASDDNGCHSPPPVLGAARADRGESNVRPAEPGAPPAPLRRLQHARRRIAARWRSVQVKAEIASHVTSSAFDACPGSSTVVRRGRHGTPFYLCNGNADECAMCKGRPWPTNEQEREKLANLATTASDDALVQALYASFVLGADKGEQDSIVALTVWHAQAEPENAAGWIEHMRESWGLDDEHLPEVVSALREMLPGRHRKVFVRGVSEQFEGRTLREIETLTGIPKSSLYDYRRG